MGEIHAEVHEYYQLLDMEPRLPLPENELEANLIGIEDADLDFYLACQYGHVDHIDDFILSQPQLPSQAIRQFGRRVAASANQAAIARHLIRRYSTILHHRVFKFCLGKADGKAESRPLLWEYNNRDNDEILLPLMQVFVDSGWHPNQAISEAFPEFTLIPAVYFNNQHLVHFFLLHGANPHLGRDGHLFSFPGGRLTLHSAEVFDTGIRNLDPELLCLLLSHGANPSVSRHLLNLAVDKSGELAVVGPRGQTHFLIVLSEIYGRRPVLIISNVFFCVWQIGCALAPNITLGGSIIGDLFRTEQRGFAIGVWNIGPLLGPTIGPLIGGILAKTIGWRWDFWILFIAAVPITALSAVLNKETCHKVILDRKAARLRKQLNNPALRSSYQDSKDKGKGTIETIAVGLVRPLKMLILSPSVLFLSLYIAFVFGVLYLLYTTIPAAFTQKYGFDTDQVGLIYLALGLGNILGWLFNLLYSDKIIVRLSEANNGVFEPEMRLVTSIYFGIFLPVTLFWYGWSTQYTAPVASTIISLVPFGFGIMGLFLTILTYIVDSYPLYAASALAANVILRSVVGAFLPLAGPPLYDALGLGWGNSLLGFICVLMIPIPFVFYKFGAKLRQSQLLKI